tara:strand:+ start:200 stop:763 length:564 start_codon:yes stop_codon:yes gene_type:complete
MNLKKIIIYQNDILFDILDEIKEIINFELIKINEINSEKLKDRINSDHLIITNSEKKFFKNQLILDDYPLKIENLLELVNLKFLKDKFKDQSNIIIGNYKLDLNSRKISQNKSSLKLTEREINLILFLKRSKSPVKINELQKKVWDYNSELDTHTVETHIYRLRKKIKDEFNDDDFIVSSKKGYLII